MHIRSILSRTITNFPGWRTGRKILVIESDDWGSIRMPSKEVYEKCIEAGYPVDKTKYERYDSILSQEDLNLLMELLSSFKDKNGNHPKITANCVVANPDFQKIKDDNFRQYHYELITETFKKYPEHKDNFKIWKEGMNNNVFFPQFHAREHLNVSLFMEALREGERNAHFGFKNNMPGCVSINNKFKGNIYVESTNFKSIEDKEEKLNIFLEGLDLFKMLFGFKSESIIPPNYIWSEDFNQPILFKGVKYLQGIRKFREPVPNGYLYTRSYLGKRNKLGQLYLVRNATFEPTLDIPGIKDPIDRCLKDIQIAFMMNKPAIISSHRINYVGFIDNTNRDKNLMLLKSIFSKVLKQWPDIEFMNSVELGNLINES